MADTYKPVDAFDSMTESTFIIKPKAKASGSTGKHKAGRINISGGFVPLLQGREAPESLELRRQLFEKMWTPLEELFIRTEQEVNGVGIAEICSFVDASYTRIDTKEKGWLDPPFAELATAIAFAGVNTGDHSKLFASLRTRLRANGHHVALMESQYCSTLPGMLKYLLDQILYSEEGVGAAASSKAVAYDMNILRLWWEDKVAAAASHSSADSSRVVVVLQDLEGFPPLVVDDFIRIAGNCCGSVPIVLVLGLATSYESLHQSLTKASISTLNVERFNLQRSKQCIDAIISKVLVRCMATLSFGAEAYKSLLDQFLLYNFSITAFVRKMKYAAMDFFYAHPLSVLASMVKQTESGTVSVIDCPIQLSHDQAELIRMQRSVQRFLEHHVRAGGDRDYFNRAVNDDGFLQTVVVPQMLRKLASYRQLYSLGIDFAQAIQDESPESMRKPIRTLHYYGLSQTYGECTHWKTLSAIVRKMKAPEMELLLAKLCHIADRAVGVDWRLAAESGLDIPERLRQAQALLADPEGDNSAPSGAAATERTSSQGQTKRIRTRTDMESRPFLLFDSSSSDHVLRALDKCSGMIEDILRSCLSAYRDVPLQEVFYYKHSLLLDTTFSAQPRAAVQAALGKTAYYINCECCKASASSDEDGSEAGMGGNDEDADQRIVPSMQDTSIAYRLHQECGRMINLYDWYSAFSSVVEKEEFTAGRAPDQSETQARFLRAVEEMRLLGFIKSTQRKTDHVVRLTWGM